jgi:hypothetical protein
MENSDRVIFVKSKGSEGSVAFCLKRNLRESIV